MFNQGPYIHCMCKVAVSRRGSFVSYEYRHLPCHSVDSMVLVPSVCTAVSSTISIIGSWQVAGARHAQSATVKVPWCVLFDTRYGIYIILDMVVLIITSSYLFYKEPIYNDAARYTDGIHPSSSFAT